MIIHSEIEIKTISNNNIVFIKNTGKRKIHYKARLQGSQIVRRVMISKEKYNNLLTL